MELEEPKVRRRGGVRRKIEMRKMENEQKRLVTFTKRRQGLFKKALDLSKFCGAKTALVVFSSNGKVYSDGDVDAVFDHYLTGKFPEIDKQLSLEEGKKPLEEEEKGFWWEKKVEEIMLEGLMEHEAAVKELKKNVEAELERRRSVKALPPLFPSAPSPPPSSSSLPPTAAAACPSQSLVTTPWCAARFW